jgi:hypothetical protein
VSAFGWMMPLQTLLGERNAEPEFTCVLTALLYHALVASLPLRDGSDRFAQRRRDVLTLWGWVLRTRLADLSAILRFDPPAKVKAKAAAQPEMIGYNVLGTVRRSNRLGSNSPTGAHADGGFDLLLGDEDSAEFCSWLTANREAADRVFTGHYAALWGAYPGLGAAAPINLTQKRAAAEVAERKGAADAALRFAEACSEVGTRRDWPRCSGPRSAHGAAQAMDEQTVQSQEALRVWRLLAQSVADYVGGSSSSHLWRFLTSYEASRDQLHKVLLCTPLAARTAP